MLKQTDLSADDFHSEYISFGLAQSHNFQLKGAYAHMQNADAAFCRLHHYIYSDHLKGKVIPLQARCGPEDG